MEKTFFKGVLLSDLRDNYVPGSITTSLSEASMWADRIQSKKTKGAARHVRHGKSVVIQMTIDTTKLKDCTEFQRSGVKEHERDDCWMNAARSKAQVNRPVCYTIL